MTATGEDVVAASMKRKMTYETLSANQKSLGAHSQIPSPYSLELRAAAYASVLIKVITTHLTASTLSTQHRVVDYMEL